MRQVTRATRSLLRLRAGAAINQRARPCAPARVSKRPGGARLSVWGTRAPPSLVMPLLGDLDPRLQRKSSPSAAAVRIAVAGAVGGELARGAAASVAEVGSALAVVALHQLAVSATAVPEARRIDAGSALSRWTGANAAPSWAASRAGTCLIEGRRAAEASLRRIASRRGGSRRLGCHLADHQRAGGRESPVEEPPQGLSPGQSPGQRFREKFRFVVQIVFHLLNLRWYGARRRQRRRGGRRAIPSTPLGWAQLPGLNSTCMSLTCPARSSTVISVWFLNSALVKRNSQVPGTTPTTVKRPS